MIKYAYYIEITTDQSLSRRDFEDLAQSVAMTVTGSGGKWDPEDFSGEVLDVTAAVMGVEPE